MARGLKYYRLGVGLLPPFLRAGMGELQLPGKLLGLE
jgi:hypothetical protein